MLREQRLKKIADAVCEKGLTIFCLLLQVVHLQ